MPTEQVDSTASVLGVAIAAERVVIVPESGCAPTVSALCARRRDRASLERSCVPSCGRTAARADALHLAPGDCQPSPAASVFLSSPFTVRSHTSHDRDLLLGPVPIMVQPQHLLVQTCVRDSLSRRPSDPFGEGSL